MSKNQNNSLNSGKNQDCVYNPGSAANGWKKASLILGALLTVSVIYLICQAGDANHPDGIYIQYYIAGFVKDIRSISSDPVVLRKQLVSAYALTSSKGKKQLDRIIKQLELSKKLSSNITVSVAIESVDLKNRTLCVVSWTETVFKGPKIISQEKYKGFFRLRFKDPGPSKTGYLINPAGIYVNNITIEKMPDKVKTP